MTTYDGLNRRVVHLEDEYRPLLDPPGPREAFLAALVTHLELFTDQEQEQLQAYQAQVEPKIHLHKGRIGLSEFTDRERDEGRLWCELGEALEREDREAAARWRRWLHQGIDSLITQFMSIDEQSIPEAESGRVPMIQEGHIIHTMSRIMYRYAKMYAERAIAQNGFTGGELDDMRRWVEWAERQKSG